MQRKAALAKQSKEATRGIRDQLTILGGKVDETVTAVQKVEENVASGEEELITDANLSLQKVHERFNQLTKNRFKKPAQARQTFVSKVYPSSATSQFCFTIAVPLFKSQVFCGVLGIDINFKDILEV